MIKCETIELNAGEVVKREYKNISSVVCATAEIMNIGDVDVLIGNENKFTDGNYITIPSGTAFNGWKFGTKTVIYFKSESACKVTVGISEGW